MSPTGQNVVENARKEPMMQNEAENVANLSSAEPNLEQQENIDETDEATKCQVAFEDKNNQKDMDRNSEL